MKTYSQMVEALKKVKEKGYILTHRKGPTGIGKTLEDLLGLKENNFPGPDGHKIELKSGRKDAKSMLTLFTKSPLPKKVNTLLLQKFGYVSEESKGKKILHSTINALGYNTLKSKKGFKAHVKSDRIELLYNNKAVCYWDKETLKKSFETKLPRLFYIKADSKGDGEDEEFWFNEAWLLKDFSFADFIKLLKKGKILIDIRIGQYSDGRAHDHGTGFRVTTANMELCFYDRKKVI